MAEGDKKTSRSIQRRPMRLPEMSASNENEIDPWEKNVQRLVSINVLKYPGDDKIYTFSSQNLIDFGILGYGKFGVVHKMKHIDTARIIAVKKVRCNSENEKRRERLLREQAVLMESENEPNIVRYYGVTLNEGECWICMELMDTSMNLLYKRVYHNKHNRLEENVIGHIVVCTINALDYIKRTLQIIHRDVKPSNILVDSDGSVKLCDFGISGQLKGSIATSKDAGCEMYLAPERLSGKNYSVRADVWSLGITLYEIATGQFPYEFTGYLHLKALVEGDPPLLRNCSKFHFSSSINVFCSSCLTKDARYRPKYEELKKLDFYQKYSKGGSEIAAAREVLGREAIETRLNPVEQRG